MLNLRAPVVTTWPTLGPPPRTVRARRKTLLLIAGVPAGVLVFAALVLRTGNQEIARLDRILTDGHETSAQLTGRYSKGVRTSTYFVVGRFASVNSGTARRSSRSRSSIRRVRIKW